MVRRARHNAAADWLRVAFKQPGGNADFHLSGLGPTAAERRGCETGCREARRRDKPRLDAPLPSGRNRLTPDGVQAVLATTVSLSQVPILAPSRSGETGLGR